MVKRLWAIRTVLIGLLGGFGLGLTLCWFLYLRPEYSLYFALCGGIGGLVSCNHGNRNVQYAIALGVALCNGVLGAVLSQWSAVVVAGLTVYVLAFGGGTLGGATGSMYLWESGASLRCWRRCLPQGAFQSCGSMRL